LGRLTGFWHSQEYFLGSCWCAASQKPRAIGTVQIQVLNGLSQEVLSRKPSQQFDHPLKGYFLQERRKLWKKEINQINNLQTGV
jgi:hypothetical protein